MESSSMSGYVWIAGGDQPGTLRTEFRPWSTGEVRCGVREAHGSGGRATGTPGGKSDQAIQAYSYWNIRNSKQKGSDRAGEGDKPTSHNITREPTKARRIALRGSARVSASLRRDMNPGQRCGDPYTARNGLIPQWSCRGFGATGVRLSLVRD